MPKQTIGLPALPDQFRAAALALPDRVKEALPSIVTAIMACDALAKIEAMGLYASRIKADTETVNSITVAKLLLQDKLGQIFAPDPPEKSGSKKGARRVDAQASTLSRDRVKLCRKISKYGDRIDEYAEKNDQIERLGF